MCKKILLITRENLWIQFFCFDQITGTDSIWIMGLNVSKSGLFYSNEAQTLDIYHMAPFKIDNRNKGTLHFSMNYEVPPLMKPTPARQNN